MYYGTSDLLKEHISIKVILNLEKSRKIMIVLDNHSSVDYIRMKIIEHLDNLPEFNNLRGLKPVNLLIQSNEKSEKIAIDSNSEISNLLKDGSIVYCDLITSEFWIAMKILVSTTMNKISIKFDMKVPSCLTFRELKLLILKMTISFWNEQMDKDYFHFVIQKTNLKIISSSKLNSLGLLEGENYVPSESDLEELELSEVLDFYSELSSSVEMITIEEMIFTELKNYPYDSFTTLDKWNDFSVMDFIDFTQNIYFQEEFQYVCNIVKRFINKIYANSVNRNSSSTNSILNKFYLYHTKLDELYDKDEKDEFAIHSEAAILIVLPSNSKVINLQSRDYKMHQEENPANEFRFILNELPHNVKGNMFRSFIQTSSGMGVSDFNAVTSHECSGKIRESFDSQDLRTSGAHRYQNNDDNEKSISNDLLSETNSPDRKFNTHTTHNFLEGHVPRQRESKLDQDLNVTIKNSSPVNLKLVKNIVKSNSESNGLLKTKELKGSKLILQHPKYGSQVLTNDFKNLFQKKKIDIYYFHTKINCYYARKFSLENLSLCEMRKIGIEFIDNQITTREIHRTPVIEPLSENNKKVFVFVLVMFLVFLAGVVVIILTPI